MLALGGQRAQPGSDTSGDARDLDARGWLIDGTKVFCTMSPAATHLMAAVTYVADDGSERYGFAQIAVETPAS